MMLLNRNDRLFINNKYYATFAGGRIENVVNHLRPEPGGIMHDFCGNVPAGTPCERSAASVVILPLMASPVKPGAAGDPRRDLPTAAGRRD